MNSRVLPPQNYPDNFLHQIMHRSSYLESKPKSTPEWNRKAVRLKRSEKALEEQTEEEKLYLLNKHDFLKATSADIPGIDSAVRASPMGC